MSVVGRPEHSSCGSQSLYANLRFARGDRPDGRRATAKPSFGVGDPPKKDRFKSVRGLVVQPKMRMLLHYIQDKAQIAEEVDASRVHHMKAILSSYFAPTDGAIKH
jgi:hypothetical protein